MIFFEGTYTTTFSGNKDPDAAVRLQPGDVPARPGRPAARASGGGSCGSGVVSSFRLVLGPRMADHQPASEIAFFAPDRPGLATVPIVERRGEPGGQVLLAAATDARAIAGRKTG